MNRYRIVLEYTDMVGDMPHPNTWDIATLLHIGTREALRVMTVDPVILTDEEGSTFQYHHNPLGDESLMGGPYHGPSNSPGLTRREYAELQADDRSPYDDLDPNEGRDDDRDEGGDDDA